MSMLSIISEKLYLLKAFCMKPDLTAGGKFYLTAIGCLGTDVTPDDTIPDDVDCADTVNAIHKKAFGFPIGGYASTYMLYQALLKSPFFKQIDLPEDGCVVISPTGFGNGNLSNGHIGIVGKNTIMSNDSLTGLFTSNYTLSSWKDRYGRFGGFPVKFFKRI